MYLICKFESTSNETVDNYLLVNLVVCLSAAFSVPGEYMYIHYLIKCAI